MQGKDSKRWLIFPLCTVLQMGHSQMWWHLRQQLLSRGEGLTVTRSKRCCLTTGFASLL